MYLCNLSIGGLILLLLYSFTKQFFILFLRNKNHSPCFQSFFDACALLPYQTFMLDVRKSQLIGASIGETWRKRRRRRKWTKKKKKKKRWKRRNWKLACNLWTAFLGYFRCFFFFPFEIYPWFITPVVHLLKSLLHCSALLPVLRHLMLSTFGSSKGRSLRNPYIK